MVKKDPVEPKITRVVISDDDTTKINVDKLFEQETADMKFNQIWISYEKKKGVYEDWAKT